MEFFQLTDQTISDITDELSFGVVKGASNNKKNCSRIRKEKIENFRSHSINHRGFITLFH